ncbi:hypothetical protein [Streptomyces sp. NPDC046832]|uniref:hypothetical protein n=1 Tax=Streptomyces sp. NPDC046832 TaxID=3155020 RepID=UPI0033DF055C
MAPVQLDEDKIREAVGLIDAMKRDGHAGKVAAAAAAFADLVGDHKRVLGPNHPDTLASVWWIIARGR